MAALLGHGLIDNSVFVIDLAFIFMFQLAAALMRLQRIGGAGLNCARKAQTYLASACCGKLLQMLTIEGGSDCELNHRRRRLHRLALV